jgi:hypothetical protein
VVSIPESPIKDQQSPTNQPSKIANRQFVGASTSFAPITPAAT